MFQSRTVFVVGAGASNEVGLPVGGELAKRISQMLDVRFEWGQKPIGNGDFELFGQLMRENQDQANDLLHAGWVIRDGIILANSIDDFLERHQADHLVVRYGKVAIVKAILDSEKRCRLFVDRSRNRDELGWATLANTWYIKLFRMLCVGITNADVGDVFSNVSFIVFNYDRCLQQFLIEALQPAYRIDLATARKLVAEATILHPYGSVGAVCGAPLQHEVPFGKVDRGIPRLELIEGVRTYGEGLEDGEHLDAVRREVANAETLVFLGFAFHAQNMRLLASPQGGNARRVFATAYGMSDADTKVVHDEIQSLLRGSRRRGRIRDVHIENRMTCAELFDAFSKSLPASVAPTKENLSLRG
jgi:hypothetical protein